MNILVNKSPYKYRNKVIYKNGKSILYIIVLQVIYEILINMLLWYKKLKKDAAALGSR